MTKTQKIISSVIMMTLLLASAFAQSQQSSQNSNKTAANSGTSGRIAKWVGAQGSPSSALGDSYITEDKFGRVGIGITSPTSPLTVNGLIETTGAGGIKFPDGTMQTTAAQGVVVPLVLSGSISEPILSVRNISTIFATNAIAVSGESVGGAGVIGSSFSLSGVIGRSNVGIGVDGRSGFSIGVNAESSSDNDGHAAIFASGRPNGAFAGRFSGNVDVNGTLSKSGGSFKIDHPLDPENKYLSHSFVESPDMMNIYNGNVTTDHQGFATVELPDYFESLNSDFRYQLTVVGQFAQAIIAEKVKDNRFVIQTSAPGVEVSWQVTGVRQDAWARKNRIRVEEKKSDRERGFYLHPEAFGQAEERGVEWAHRPDQMREIKQRRAEVDRTRRTKN